MIIAEVFVLSICFYKILYFYLKIQKNDGHKVLNSRLYPSSCYVLATCFTAISNKYLLLISQGYSISNLSFPAFTPTFMV